MYDKLQKRNGPASGFNKSRPVTQNLQGDESMVTLVCNHQFRQDAEFVRATAVKCFRPVAMGLMSATEFDAQLAAAKSAILCEATHLSLEECFTDRPRYEARLGELHRRSQDMTKDYISRRAAKEVRHDLVLAVLGESQRRAQAARIV